MVLTKNGEFFVKGYMSNGLFVLNTAFMNVNISSYAYVIEAIDL